MTLTSNQFCQCKEDGYCLRYGRDMRGRFREICQGINVDLGTAAAFRHQWMMEKPCADGVKIDSERTKLLLATGQAPGDALAMTAAIYSLHKAHPGKYHTWVESYWPDVFAHNPDVAGHFIPAGGASPMQSRVEMHYPAIHQSNDRAIHFMQGWCEFLGSALGIDVPLMTNHPFLYFKEPTPPVENFWLICSGGKRDFTTKLWGQSNYQKVVDMLKGQVEFVQVGGARPVVPWRADTAGSQEDIHQKLDGVVDMVGKTSLRELFDLARRARGILCGVSLLMHVAAALEKPAVVVAGGREPVPWNSYPKQQYLHTVGALPCHDTRGRAGGACWRYRTVPLGDNPALDRDPCERPIDGVPECMRLIAPAQVVEQVMRYNQCQ